MAKSSWETALVFTKMMLLCLMVVVPTASGMPGVPATFQLSFNQFSSNQSFESYFLHSVPGIVIDVDYYLSTDTDFYTSRDQPIHLNLSTVLNGAEMNNSTFCYPATAQIQIDDLQTPSTFITLALGFVIRLTSRDATIGSANTVRAFTLFTSSDVSVNGRVQVQNSVAQFDTGEKLFFGYSYYCSSHDWYGLRCDTYCLAQSTPSGAQCYSCNTTTGAKQCCNDNFDPANNCTNRSQLTSTALPLNGPTASSSSSSFFKTDREKLYFWIMIGVAVLCLLILILLIILLICCCVYYRRAEGGAKYSRYAAPRYQYRPGSTLSTGPSPPPPPPVIVSSPPPHKVTATDQYSRPIPVNERSRGLPVMQQQQRYPPYQMPPSLDGSYTNTAASTVDDELAGYGVPQPPPLRQQQQPRRRHQRSITPPAPPNQQQTHNNRRRNSESSTGGNGLDSGSGTITTVSGQNNIAPPRDPYNGGNRPTRPVTFV